MKGTIVEFRLMLAGLCAVFTLGFAQAQISSTFDADADGWTALDHQAGSTPDYFSTGGNPGGYLYVEDGVAGTATYFVAPAKFLGNRAAYYGGILSFDLQVDRAPNSNTAGVRLTGGGLVLAKLIAPTVSGLPAVAPNWSQYSFQLNDTEGWRITSPATGNLATAEQIQTVLDNLTEIAINGEYSVANNDGGGLDNVTMTPGTPQEPEDPDDITIYTALSPNGDELNDFWLIENIELRSDTRENNVIIFNRWGDRVWEGVDYNNVDVVFSGNDDSGKKLLPGIYYYEITFTSGRKTETGFISIRY